MVAQTVDKVPESTLRRQARAARRSDDLLSFSAPALDSFPDLQTSSSALDDEASKLAKHRSSMDKAVSIIKQLSGTLEDSLAKASLLGKGAQALSSSVGSGGADGEPVDNDRIRAFVTQTIQDIYSGSIKLADAKATVREALAQVVRFYAPFKSPRILKVRMQVLEQIRAQGASSYLEVLKGVNGTMTQMFLVEEENRMAPTRAADPFLQDDAWTRPGQAFDASKPWWASHAPPALKFPATSSVLSGVGVLVNQVITAEEVVSQIMEIPKLVDAQKLIYATLFSLYFRNDPKTNMRLWPVLMNMDQAHFDRLARLRTEGPPKTDAIPTRVNADQYKPEIYVPIENIVVDAFAGTSTYTLKLIQNMGPLTAVQLESGRYLRDLLAKLSDNVPAQTPEESQFVKSAFAISPDMIKNMDPKILGSASLAEAHYTWTDEYSTPLILKFLKPYYIFLYMCELDFLLTDVWVGMRDMADRLFPDRTLDQRRELLRQAREGLCYSIREINAEFDYGQEHLNTIEGYQVYNNPAQGVRSIKSLFFAADPFPVMVQTVAEYDSRLVEPVLIPETQAHQVWDEVSERVRSGEDTPITRFLVLYFKDVDFKTDEFDLRQAREIVAVKQEIELISHFLPMEIPENRDKVAAFLLKSSRSRGVTLNGFLKQLRHLDELLLRWDRWAEVREAILKAVYQRVQALSVLWMVQTFWLKGFFHADGHQGNLMIGSLASYMVPSEGKNGVLETKPVSVTLIDFGSSGVLPTSIQCKFVDALFSWGSFTDLGKRVVPKLLPGEEPNDAEVKLEPPAAPLGQFFRSWSALTRRQQTVALQRLGEPGSRTWRRWERKHLANVKVTRRTIEHLWDICQPRDRDVDHLSLAVLDYASPCDFGIFFLRLMQLTRDLGACVSNELLMLGRAINYLSTLVSAVQVACGKGCVTWDLSANLVPMLLKNKKMQLIRASVGLPVCSK